MTRALPVAFTRLALARPLRHRYWLCPVTPNDCSQRRARRRLGLALYLSRVRSSEVLGDMPIYWIS